MATRPDPPEPAVDELKRRARRRLIGAIVLALAAAVILPILLESQPKNFGDDVTVKIPPIDNGKFVTPLSPEKASSAQGAARKGATPAQTSAAGAGDAERRPPEQSAPPPSAASAAHAQAGAGSPADAAAAKTSAPEAASATTGAGFVVQVAAFADAQAAADVATKLLSAGFPAYTEASAAGPGADQRVQRVRIGPFGSREAADAALAKVKAAGYGSAIVSAK